MSQSEKPGSSNRDTKPYVCHYFYDGTEWGLTVYAYDDEDAEARVKKMGIVHLNGELMMTIPAQLGWFAKAACWLRNQIL